MDYYKETAVLKFVNVLWGKEVASLQNLKDGNFFVYLLHLINPMTGVGKESDCTNASRLLYVRDFLQDFYGDTTDINTFIKFGDLATDTCTSEEVSKLELAKISIVLLGIGLLGPNKNIFMSSALGVPSDLQEDVLEIIQTVIGPDSGEVMLTDNIDSVLKQPTESRRHSPVFELMKASDFADKHYVFSPLAKEQTPDRRLLLQEDNSLRELSSPFRALEIKSPSSSLINFTKSPQFIQKAVMKQRDMELRKHKEMLNFETFQKEEAEAALHEKIIEISNKDLEIHQLQEKIRQLQNVSVTSTDSLDLKSNPEIYVLKQKLQSMEKFRGKCETLEVDNRVHTEEMAKLRLKIKSLEADVTKNKKLQNTVYHLESQVQKLGDELLALSDSKTHWEEEKRCFCHKLDTLRAKNRDLEQQLEDMQSQGFNDRLESSGESMGVVADIQISELKDQLESMKQEKENLLDQLEEYKKEIKKFKSQSSSQDQSLNILKETNSNLNSALNIEKDTQQKMKVHMDSLMTKLKDMTVKYEALQEANKTSAKELKSLTVALKDTQKQLQTLQEQQKLEMSESISSPSIATAHQSENLLQESSSGKNTSESIRMKARLSSGYDSVSSSPDQDLENFSISLPKETLIIETRSGMRRRRNNKSSTQRDPPLRDPPLLRPHRESTLSLQSIKSMKELLPGVFPNATSCANEPEDQSFEWDKLSRLNDDCCSISETGDKKVNPFRDVGRIQKRKLPLRPSSIENIEMTTPVKQKKTSSTVIYFPLNPNGPVYPPPRPTINFKGKSGRQNTETPGKGKKTLNQENNANGNFATNWRTNP